MTARAAAMVSRRRRRLASGPDGGETIDLDWFRPEDLPTVDLGPFAEATFEELGWLEPSPE